ncbi:hypothetical protein SAMN05216188_125117 [Lentzea xinjiangensis]|uniref:Uncharacterized protein n=1 Tax=Lentzea xinjiangensis TaxID=402600 RepID=A0A1H9VCG8_9PSEU|nr:hypothetical protein [Lentzea xinjiangensis]SES19269.1 hypothetical protein SAMN05216188_125117 [Lentzea xinjiangensis]
MTSTFYNETKLGEVNYRLSATTDSGDSLVLDLLGSLDSGEVIADGRLRMPVEGAATVGRLLSRVLGAHTRLRTRPSRHANANQPWTESLDTELRTAWLTPSEDSAPKLIKSLADSMQRSATAIRARLARVGCDPDVPGRELSPTAAILLGASSGTGQGKT